MNFPSSPTIGQEYTVGTRTWRFNGTGWALKSALTIEDIPSLESALGGKSDVGHGHAIDHVSGLQDALDGKQPAGNYAAATHSHAIGNISGLQDALDGKAASSHGHTAAQISGLQNGATTQIIVSTSDPSGSHPNGTIWLKA